jgi:hypothetical protein
LRLVERERERTWQPGQGPASDHDTSRSFQARWWRERERVLRLVERERERRAGPSK